MPDRGGASERAASKIDDVEPAKRAESRRAGSESPDLNGSESSTETPSGTPERGSETTGTTSIDVEIFGSVYHVRGEQNREYLRSLAKVVDGKMREISRHVPVVDSGKIAILAALNLADELLQCNNHQEGERVEMMGKVEELTGLLAAALDT